MTSMSESSSPKPPLFEVAGLNAYYSGAHVLHDVTFEIGGKSVAIIGRNGMGKTTLCAAIMGLAPPRAAGMTVVLVPNRSVPARHRSFCPVRHQA